VQRLRRFPEEHGTRIRTPEARGFETEGEAIESWTRRTIGGRDTVSVVLPPRGPLADYSRLQERPCREGLEGMP
jgi:hypothetical protein